MKLEKTEVSKVSFKNCTLQKDENGDLFFVEDLGEKGIETQKIEDVILAVFGEEPFSMTIQSKVEL